jgi:hypothetical protein
VPGTKQLICAWHHRFKGNLHNPQVPHYIPPAN